MKRILLCFKAGLRQTVRVCCVTAAIWVPIYIVGAPICGFPAPAFKLDPQLGSLWEQWAWNLAALFWGFGLNAIFVGILMIANEPDP